MEIRSRRFVMISIVHRHHWLIVLVSWVRVIEARDDQRSVVVIETENEVVINVVVVVVVIKNDVQDQKVCFLPLLFCYNSNFTFVKIVNEARVAKERKNHVVVSLKKRIKNVRIRSSSVQDHVIDQVNMLQSLMRIKWWQLIIVK